MTPEEMRDRLSAHVIDADRAEALEEIRHAYIRLAEDMAEDLPEGRYQSLAMTALEESAMWAVKAFTRDGE